MNWLHAVILGIIEGITEFLPVSSTGHLNIVEKLLDYDINDKGITAFTAVIQIGAILAAVIYFWSDIVRIVTATRLSFFMGIPALIAAGLLEAVTAAGDISSNIGWTPTIIATIVSGLVAYATIAWLLKFVSSNKFTGFLVYRVILGAVIIALVASGMVEVS